MKALLLTLLLAAGEDRPDTHTVKAGDTCVTVTTQHWGPAAKVDELHKYNNLGPTPHKLVPGQVLRLRAEDPNTPDATLTFLKPAVRARKAAEWEPATVGMGLYRLNEVNTLRRAGAELTLRDLSQLLLDENALVVIYGEPNAQQVTRGPAVIEGEVRVALSGARAIELPGGATVTGAKASGVTAVDGRRTGLISIFEGDVTVESQKVAVKLGADQGSVVRPNAPPSPARPLPLPPEVQPFAPVVAAGRDGVASVEIEWAQVANAARYRVQLARDERFLDLAVSELTTTTSLKLQHVPPGQYRLRVIAFDIDGLQGRASPPQRLDVVAIGVGVNEAGVVTLRAGETPAFTGPEGYALTPPPQTLPAGHHALEVRDGAGELVATLPVSVRPGPPRVRMDNSVLTLEFDTDVAAANGLSVTDVQGNVALEQTGPRRFIGTRKAKGTTTVRFDEFDLLRFEL